MTRKIAASAHLSERSKDLWRDLVGRRAASPECLALLRVALEHLDRADRARELVDAEGLTTTNRRSKLTRPHPMLAVERSARRDFERVWRVLALHRDHWLDGGAA